MAVNAADARFPLTKLQLEILQQVRASNGAGVPVSGGRLCSAFSLARYGLLELTEALGPRCMVASQTPSGLELLAKREVARAGLAWQAIERFKTTVRDLTDAQVWAALEVFEEEIQRRNATKKRLV
jgi:hypothetical protein